MIDLRGVNYTLCLSPGDGRGGVKKISQLPAPLSGLDQCVAWEAATHGHSKSFEVTGMEVGGMMCRAEVKGGRRQGMEVPTLRKSTLLR